MSHAHNHASGHDPEHDPEAERARELLERTMRFLSRCMEDPEAALKSDDPRALIQGLRSLARPPAEEKTPAAPPIQIRRRRSA